jgi:hypothetical protein
MGERTGGTVRYWPGGEELPSIGELRFLDDGPPDAGMEPIADAGMDPPVDAGEEPEPDADAPNPQVDAEALDDGGIRDVGSVEPTAPSGDDGGCSQNQPGGSSTGGLFLGLLVLLSFTRRWSNTA